MNNAVLNLSFRENCLNCRRKTGQIVRTGNENILDVLADAGLIFRSTLVQIRSCDPAAQIPLYRQNWCAGFCCCARSGCYPCPCSCCLHSPAAAAHDFFATCVFSWDFFPSCHCDYLRHPASILHLVGGLHKVWDGVTAADKNWQFRLNFRQHYQFLLFDFGDTARCSVLDINRSVAL